MLLLHLILEQVDPWVAEHVVVVLVEDHGMLILSIDADTILIEMLGLV